METIKFRIYNPEEKKMWESGATPMMLKSFFENTARFNTQLKMPYQQFTGLLDKQNKEIYEGDIIVDDFFGKATVKFENGKFNPFYKQEPYSEDTKYCPENVEVIGNIYENPNLLV